ncbi:MAG TPA: hypothetical protein VMX17_10130 [Candidatus Glassbacteria bacterium]|nr:hypothetical protein [Candidatus Glassbacteria bacterium]
MLREFKNLQHKIKKDFLEKFSETLWVTLKKSNSMGSNFDPFRNVGYTTTNQSPIPVKARVRVLSPDSLIRREIGLVQIGAIEVEIEERYADMIKICQKISYNKEDYTPYKKAAGNQCQITKGDFGISKIILFKIGN